MPNPNTAEHAEVMAVNVSTCNLLSVSIVTVQIENLVLPTV